MRRGRLRGRESRGEGTGLPQEVLHLQQVQQAAGRQVAGTLNVESHVTPIPTFPNML